MSFENKTILASTIGRRDRLDVFTSVVLTLSLVGGCTAEDEEPLDIVDAQVESERPLDEPAEQDEDQDEPPAGHDGEDSDEEVFGLAVGQPIEVEDGIVLYAPEPGQQTTIEVIYTDGVMATASLTHDLDGRMFIGHPDDDLVSVPENTSASCLGKCLDPLYSFNETPPARWTDELQWYYRTLNSPVGDGVATDVFEYAAAAVPTARNACGLADNINATEAYQGQITGTGPGVPFSGGTVSCAVNDGINVVGWGALPSDVLGVACHYDQQDTPARRRMTGMGIKLNKDSEWFTGTSVPGSCSGAYSLRAVATHEFGHTFGLGHAASCNLVMAPSLGPCNASKRKFGLGDILALEELY